VDPEAIVPHPQRQDRQAGPDENAEPGPRHRIRETETLLDVKREEEGYENGHAAGARHRLQMRAPVTRVIHDLGQETEIAEVRLHQPRHAEGQQSAQQRYDLPIHAALLTRR